MTFATKEDAFKALEEARAEFLDAARAWLRTRAIGSEATADDVRAAVPVPEGTDGRVMGAVFAGEKWVADGWTKSTRAACHHRPIRVFRRVA